MAGFRFRDDDDAPPESPEALFRDLRPRDRQVRDLYLRQGDLLRAYRDLPPNTRDVALELPTGAGKTLVGLLIAEWRRRALGHRVAYLCPTVQLARQAANKAEGYGLEVVTLVRRQAEWPEADWSRYVRGRAIAISTYFALFNSNPRLNNAQTIVFDDAHAGEEPVSSMWSITARRESDLYRALLAAVIEDLPSSVSERLTTEDLEGVRRRRVDLVPPLAVLDRSQPLIEAVRAHASGDNSYAAGVIGDNLATCLMYVSWSEILLRPLVAPTAAHSPFASAGQRVYMSATLGSAGELERAFGVDRVTRPRVPTREDELGFGRRLFLMPGASQGVAEADETIRASIQRAGRAVLLAQSTAALEELVTDTIPPTCTVVSAEEIEREPSAFTERESAVLALANRYDGIDLPDQACRVIVISGLPIGAHLQERFLSDRLGAARVLAERVRTRLTQGAGRCTRNPQDFAAVFLRGADLLDFCARDEELEALRPELQAEIEFGLDTSEQAEADFLQLLESFLVRDDEWRRADDYLRRRASERTRQAPPGSDALFRAASFEVECWRALWRGDFGRAIDLAQQATDALSGGEEMRPYRALWTYLAASWARYLGEQGEQEQLELAERLQADAERIAERLPWVPNHPRRPNIARVPEVGEREERAVDQLRELAIRGVRFEKTVGELREQIGSDDSDNFERGLEHLGKMLGFDVLRPRGQAAPDGAWRSENTWVVWEAKTEERAGAPVSVATVRQASSHVRWLEQEGAWDAPDRTLTVIVSPRTTVDPAAAQVAAEERLVTPRLIRSIAADTIEAYRQVRSRASSLDDLGRARGFSAAFAARRLTTPELLARLSERRVVDG